MHLVSKLQAEEPGIFTPPAVYDGQRKMYAIHELDLGNTGSKDVVLDAMVYEIWVQRVGQSIDTSVLHRFVAGTQSQNSSVTVARQALDVALRMTPLTTLKIGNNRQIFYVPSLAKPIGLGVVLCRGFFQSLRPAPYRLLVNVDIHTRAVYLPGPLVDLAREYIETHNLRTAPEHKWRRLAQFITGIRVEWPVNGSGHMVRTVKGLSKHGANRESFTRRGDGRTQTIAQYFNEVLNRPLRHPDLPCVQVGRPDAGRGALVPMELCVVLPDQRLHTGVPDKVAREYVNFSARPPNERLQLVETGLQALGSGQSEYVRQFGITVQPSVLSTNARVLNPPILRYRPAPGSREAPTALPKKGYWNMKGKHFYKPATIESWALLNLDPTHPQAGPFLRTIVQRFVNGCRDAGIIVVQPTPAVIMHRDSQLDVLEQLNQAEQQCVQASGQKPSLLFVVLPNTNQQGMYETVKHWGDVMRGIPTQCMKEKYCSKSDPPYWLAQCWLNVAHKVNVKLGGINTVLDHGVPLLGDSQNGTMVMAKSVQGSYAAVVSSVDSHASKYVATLRAQKQQEMISDLGDMTARLLALYMAYRREKENIRSNAAPKRIIFFRDGVSEEQFPAILQEELPEIQAVCNSLKIPPKITVVVVGKRHHLRFFDQEKLLDDEKNCVAGTVIDRDVVHPTEFDYFLQSHYHGAPRGTVRPAHYSVLYDENNLSPDDMQSLSFALCHVYARSNRAVSIPAPVHYADRVCTRWKIHFNPGTSGGQVEGPADNDSPSPERSSIEAQQGALQMLHISQQDVMYFA
ncbi:ribonuclease H-like domain-containing protein [Mycena rosella]|uniref:Ribonuclease H-like domain-containing protein n=1 Tax=Mycena rosella TaxID=1033263 RepID=A0AAD7CVI5_MYCRO|nr:ribonuclease H-like domain-containing protein [Mycena rosella]